MSIKVIGCSFYRRQAGVRTGFLVAGRPTIPLHSILTMRRSEVEKVSKALADATRLRIFEAVSAANRMNCGEIVSMRGVTPATVSHHLRILSQAGLIACRREGQFVYSQAIPKTVAAYTRALLKIGTKKKGRRRAQFRNSDNGSR
jgi:ArsR family transcriptional regulator, arsenate/arsenite/antimonite-responsive transcriptional repressor